MCDLCDATEKMKSGTDRNKIKTVSLFNWLAWKTQKTRTIWGSQHSDHSCWPTQDRNCHVMQKKVLKTSGDPISCVHFTRASCHQTVIKVCSRTFRLSCTSHFSVPYFPSACIIPLYYNEMIFYLFTGCHKCHSYTISWSHSMYLAVTLFSKQSKLISKIKYFSCLFVFFIKHPSTFQQANKPIFSKDCFI